MSINIIIIIIIIALQCTVTEWKKYAIYYLELYNTGLFRLDRNRHGGGVAIYCKSFLQPRLLNLPSHSIELIALTILHHKQLLNIACFYRPPSSHSALSTLINTLAPLGPKTCSKLILLGDFNVNFFASSSTLLSNQLASISNLLSLKQIVSRPTHYSHQGSPSTIDLVFLPPNLSTNISIFPPIGNSDHLTILTTINLKSSRPFPHSNPSKKIWLYKQADFPAIEESLSTVDCPTILTNDVNITCSTFTRTFLNIVRTHTPTKIIPQSELSPWLPRSLLSKIKLRHISFQQAMSSNSPDLWKKYRHLRNYITNAIRKSKSQYLNHSQTTQEDSGPTFDPFVALKTQFLLSKLTQFHLQHSQIKTKPVISTKLSPPSSIKNPPPSQPSITPPLSINEDHFCSLDSISNLIANLPSNTSCGPDGIPSFLIKATTASILIPLQHIFNLSISTGVFPSDWKSSIITPHSQNLSTLTFS